MAYPSHAEAREQRRQQIAILKARRERLRQDFLALEEQLRPRRHAPEVQRALDAAHRVLADMDEKLTTLELLVNT